MTSVVKLCAGVLLAAGACAQIHVVGQPAGSFAASQSTDIGDQINQAFAGCDSGCIVELDAGTYTIRTPIVMARPGLQLRGAGGRATTLVFNSEFAAAVEVRMAPFTIDSHVTVQGLSIDVQSRNSTAILTGDVTSATFRDLWITCNGNDNTSGIAITSRTGWFERNLFDSVDVKYCSTGLQLNVDPGNKYTSFGYNKFLQVGLNVGDRQTGVVIGPRVMLYHSILNLNVNMDSSRDNMFLWIAGTSHANSYQLVGEATGPTTGIFVANGGNWEDGVLTRGGLVSLDNMTNRGIR